MKAWVYLVGFLVGMVAFVLYLSGRPESSKQSLRYLAAARFYLPVTLKGGEKFPVSASGIG